jgi:hypothetical protein
VDRNADTVLDTIVDLHRRHLGLGADATGTRRGRHRRNLTSCAKPSAWAVATHNQGAVSATASAPAARNEVMPLLSTATSAALAHADIQ